MISNFRKSIMGTAEFDGKFTGMRKSQEFTAYPIHTRADAGSVTVQSDTRIGTIDLANGEVRMSPPRPGGAGFAHVPPGGSPPTDRLNAETLLLLKAAIFGTAGASVGNAVVRTDNSGASHVLGSAL